MATGCQIAYISLSGKDTSGKRQYHNLWRYIYRDDTIRGAHSKSLSEYRIHLGKSGNLIFGNNFGATAALKLIAYHHIEFMENVLVGWDAIIMDTDFHRMRNRETGTFTKGYAPVLIGRNCWIGCRCTILKGTHLPAYCTLAAGTTIGKKIDGEGYKIISNTSELKIVKENYYRELGNDAIVYPVDSINNR